MGLVGTKATSDGLIGSFECLYIFLMHILEIFLNIFIVLYLIGKNISFLMTFRHIKL